MDIRFYYVDKNYIDYLKKYELSHKGFTCVPNVEYSNRSKFVYGAVLTVNNINYFVPISSKMKNDQYSMLIQTKDKKTPVKGSLRFRYMIPIPNKCLVKLEIKSMIETERQRYVLDELAACRKNRDRIFRLAEKTYDDVCKYSSEALRRNSCDFKLLEQAYKEYCVLNHLEYQQIGNPDNNSINCEESSIVSKTTGITKEGGKCSTESNDLIEDSAENGHSSMEGWKAQIAEMRARDCSRVNDNQGENMNRNGKRGRPDL